MSVRAAMALDAPYAVNVRVVVDDPISTPPRCSAPTRAWCSRRGSHERAFPGSSGR
ncbi:MAG: hypothetical protein M5U28_24090 [Sandaracinaceae bacterium]|nr:hypothetical protein [Sandaracinaceae bacterium]